MSFDISQIRPDAISAYLAANHWTDSGVGARSEGNPILQLWTRSDYEVAVPLRADFRDYVHRLREAVETLRKAEGRGSIEVASDLVNSGYDVVRVRILSSRADEGMLPIDEAVSYVHSSRDMIMAAACSTVAPKTYFPARKPNKANEFIRRVKFGQTERGSFVFSLMAPVAPQLESFGRTTSLEPFDRQVTRTLLGGVERVKVAAAAAASSMSIDLFEQERLSGVSANLCDALSKLAGAEDNEHDFELGFSWALVNPANVIAQHILLPRSMAPILRSAATVLKAKAPADDFELIGPVIKLARADGAIVGSVTVVAEVEGQPRRVTIELEAEDYSIALSAHDRNNTLSAVGTLVKEGKLLRLQNVREVAEISLEDL